MILSIIYYSLKLSLSVKYRTIGRVKTLPYKENMC